MMPSDKAHIRRDRRPRSVGWLGFIVSLTLTLAGCASSSRDSPDISSLNPLQLDRGQLTVADAAGRVSMPELLSVDEPMREFVQHYTGGLNNSRLKLMSLHEAVRGAGSLGVQYDPFAEGSAREVFRRGTANCLSFASLFIALAREAGLEAHYQWQEVRPQWSKISDRVQVGLHVNVVVRMRDGKRFMVDIDPLPARDITGSQQLTDTEAEALFYNNISMAALADGDLETSWNYLVRALQMSPDMSLLWVNLGALYRTNDQHRDAEQSYLQALVLDFREHSAMTNLAVLYGLEGREEEQDYWLEKLDVHREANPYYHAWRGEEAAATGDWELALRHYNRAVALLPNDSNLLFARGVVYYQLNDLDDAASNIKKAIEFATLNTDVDFYKDELTKVRRAQRVGS
tara:strand:- start:29253 stop:30458 length:1206 start_codon:yes stop_codon:yes gene_type:complete